MSAREQGLPIEPHRLTPKISDTFWVNLIGRGYPAPRPKFRWCTERLKINPSNQFIRDVVRASGDRQLLSATESTQVEAGDRVVIKTPGGGGFGRKS